jgi:hypothetical protein
MKLPNTFTQVHQLLLRLFKVGGRDLPVCTLAMEVVPLQEVPQPPGSCEARTLLGWNREITVMG